MKHIEIRKNGTKRVYTTNSQVSKTEQQFAKECDVNEIMRKFMKTGQVTHLAKHQGQFVDVSEIPDLHTAMIQVAAAQQTFDLLPAELRKRFGNSPVNMVEFLQDPSNDDEAVKLGLKVRKPGLDVPVQPEPSDSAVAKSSKPSKPSKSSETTED